MLIVIDHGVASEQYGGAIRSGNWLKHPYPDVLTKVPGFYYRWHCRITKLVVHAKTKPLHVMPGAGALQQVSPSGLAF